MSRGFHVIGSSSGYHTQVPDTKFLKISIQAQIKSLKSEIVSGPWFWEKKGDDFKIFKQNKINGLNALYEMISLFEEKKKTGKEVYDFVTTIDQDYPQLCEGNTSSCSDIVSSVKAHFIKFKIDPANTLIASPCLLI